MLSARMLPRVNSSRWHRHGKRGSAELLSKSGLIIRLSASSFRSGIYHHAMFCSIPPRRENTDLILPRRNTTIFGSDSVDYGSKFSRCPARTPQEMGKSEGWSHQSSFELIGPCDTVCRFLARPTLHLGDNPKCLADDNFLKSWFSALTRLYNISGGNPHRNLS